MGDASGHDDTIASADATVQSLDVASAETIGTSPLAAPDAPALPVVAAESYVRIDEYARGGLGRIIRAKDRRTGRSVAIKEMLADNTDASARFVREAMVTANLQHPAIVPVYEVGQWPDGKPFYAMKLVRGRPLSDEIAAIADLDGRLGLLAHVAAVADALAYAHGERIIHRDLKPQNVLVGAFGETVVIDWGLARRLDESDSAVPPQFATSVADGQTHVGAILGTPSYMAPEQARGERADERTDVYAIGAILYHVLAGRPPHVDRDLEKLLELVQNAPPPPLPSEVPPDLTAIVERALAREPAARYPSAAELASDLRRFMTGQLVLAHRYTRRERFARFVARNRGTLAVAVVALAICAVGATLAIRNIMIARRDATASRDVARARLVASYVDRAGVELVAGHPDRALAYTIASADPRDGFVPDTRLMTAHALDQLPMLRWYLERTDAVGFFVPGSHDLVIGMVDVVRWDPDKDEVRWRLANVGKGDVRLVGREHFAFARDTTVTLGALADGKTIAELAGSDGAHYPGLLGIDANAKWLAAVAPDRIDLFDLASRALVASIPFAGATRRPRIATDGERMIVNSTPNAMSIIDRTGSVVGTFQASVGNVELAGDELVYPRPIGANGIAQLVVGDWTGKARLELVIGASDIHALAVDGNLVALGTDDGVVQVRSIVTGEVLWQVPLGDRIAAVRFDGGTLRVLTTSTGVIGFDAASGIEVERALVSGNQFWGTDDHARVAVHAQGIGMTVYSPAHGEITPIAPTPAQIVDLALEPDGTVIAAGADGELHEVRDARSVRKLGTGAPITMFTRLDDGTLVTASADGEIVVRERDGRELHRFNRGSLAKPSPDGRSLLTPGPGNGAAIWQIASGTPVLMRGIYPDKVQSLEWSSDGRRFAAMYEGGRAPVWNLDGSLVREVPRSNHSAGTIAFSHDGKWLARTGVAADTLFALDGGDDRRLRDVRGPVIVARFSPDDRTVLLAGTGFIGTWDVATGNPKLYLATNTWITAATFLDGGRYMIGGGSDNRVRVWNAETGVELLAFNTPARPLRFIVDPDGKRVGVITARGAMIWRIPTFTGTLEELRELARCRLDVEIRDAHVTARAIDVKACNRTAP